MIDLDGIQKMWNNDSKINPDNLHTESLNIPVLATLPSVKKIDKGYHLSQMFLEDV